MFVHPDVIKVIAADLPGRNVDPGNFESGNGRRFFRKQNPLNIARDFQVVIEPLFFIRLGVNDGVVEGEGGLLRDRFEDNKITRREWRTHRTVANREHAHVLFAIKQRRGHQRSGPERCFAQARQFRYVSYIRERNGLRRLPDGATRFARGCTRRTGIGALARSEEHTSELQSLAYLVCRLLLEKKKTSI